MKKEYLILGAIGIIGLYFLMKKKNKAETNVEGQATVKTDNTLTDIKCPSGKVKKAVGSGVAGGFIYACVDETKIGQGAFTNTIKIGNCSNGQPC